MKTKLINALILWLLMIPLSGVLLMAYANQPIEDPTHTASVTVVDLQGNPRDSMIVVMTVHMFGKNGIHESDETYAFTDENGYAHMAMSAPDMIPTDSTFCFVDVHIDDSLHFEYQNDRYLVQGVENPDNYIVAVTEEEYKTLKGEDPPAIESVNRSAYITVRKDGALAPNVKVRLRVYYDMWDDDDYLDFDGTTNSNGVANISGSVPNSPYHFLQVIMIDRDYYVMTMSGGEKYNSNITNCQVVVDRPIFNTSFNINGNTTYLPPFEYNRTNVLNSPVVMPLIAQFRAGVKQAIHDQGFHKKRRCTIDNNMDYHLKFRSDDKIDVNVNFYDLWAKGKKGGWLAWVKVYLTATRAEIDGTIDVNNSSNTNFLVRLHGDHIRFETGGILGWVFDPLGIYTYLASLIYDNFIYPNHLKVNITEEVIPSLPTIPSELQTLMNAGPGYWIFSDIEFNANIDTTTGNTSMGISLNTEKTFDGTCSTGVKTIRSLDKITAGNSGYAVVNSGAELKLVAINKVTLKPGFKANAGSAFKAHVGINPIENQSMIAGGKGSYGSTDFSKSEKGQYQKNDQEVDKDNLKMNKSQTEDLSKPNCFALNQNYPNPFNPTTTIKYALMEDVKVSLKIYNTLGQEVRTLVNEDQTAGFKEIMWDGKNNTGAAVPSGIYIYRLVAGSKFVKANKMMLVK